MSIGARAVDHVHVVGSYLMLPGRPPVEFSRHWAACAAMIRLTDPDFRSLGEDRPEDLAKEAPLHERGSCYCDLPADACATAGHPAATQPHALAEQAPVFGTSGGLGAAQRLRQDYQHRPAKREEGVGDWEVRGALRYGSKHEGYFPTRAAAQAYADAAIKAAGSVGSSQTAGRVVYYDIYPEEI